MSRQLIIILVSALLLAGCGGSDQASLQATATFTPEQVLGKKVFQQHCASCHSTIPDSVIVGPSMAGVAARADLRMEGVPARQYIQMSIDQPGEYLVEGFDNLMPKTLANILTEEEKDAVLSYLMTLD